MTNNTLPESQPVFVGPEAEYLPVELTKEQQALLDNNLDLPPKIAKKAVKNWFDNMILYEEAVGAGFFGLARATLAFDPERADLANAETSRRFAYTVVENAVRTCVYGWKYAGTKASQKGPRPKPGLFQHNVVSFDQPFRPDDESTSLVDMTPSDSFTDEIAIDELERQKVLNEAELMLQDYEPQFKQIFESHYLQGLTYQEIADATGLKYSQVKRISKQLLQQLVTIVND